MKNKKCIYLIVAKSGCGKTTIADKLKSFGMTSIDSYTTRPKRHPNETGHIFVTDEEFDKLTDLCAYTKFNGYRYCATSEQVDNNDIYILDKAGINYFLEHYKGKKHPVIIYIETPLFQRFTRMLKRGDPLHKVISRLINDHFAFKGMEQRANIVLTNKNNQLKNTVFNLYMYIRECEYWAHANKVKKIKRVKR